MISRTLSGLVPLSLFCLLLAGAPPASADASHARIIRLSLVQGDVRFARDVHGDPLADQNADVHGILMERMARLQDERQTRWQSILAKVSRPSS